MQVFLWCLMAFIYGRNTSHNAQYDSVEMQLTMTALLTRFFTTFRGRSPFKHANSFMLNKPCKRILTHIRGKNARNVLLPRIATAYQT